MTRHEIMSALMHAADLSGVAGQCTVAINTHDGTVDVHVRGGTDADCDRMRANCLEVLPMGVAVTVEAIS